MWQIEMFHKFENIDESDLVISVCLGQVSMHICATCKGSIINHIGRKERQLWGKIKLAAI